MVNRDAPMDYAIKKKGIDYSIFDKGFWLLTIFFVFETIRIQEIIPVVGQMRLPLLMSVSLALYWFSFREKDIFNEDVIKRHIAFLIFITLSFFWVINHFHAKNAIQNMYLFFVAAVLPSTLILHGFKRISMFFFIWAISNGILSIQGILSGGTGPGGFVEDENDLAMALNMGMPYAFMLSRAKTLPYLLKKLLLILGVVMCFGVIATSSRGGFLGLIAVIGMFWWWSEKRVLNLLVSGVILVIGAIAAYKLGFIPDSWIADMQTIENTEDETRNERIHSWVLGWWMFLESPIWGVGVENYAWNVNRMEAYLPYDPDYKSLQGRQSHSVFFTLIPELGLIGIFIFLSILWYMDKGCRNVARAFRHHSQSDEIHDLALMAKAIRVGMVTFLVTGTFISVLYYPHFWYLLGFLVVTEREARRVENRLNQERDAKSNVLQRQDKPRYYLKK